RRPGRHFLFAALVGVRAISALASIGAAARSATSIPSCGLRRLHVVNDLGTFADAHGQLLTSGECAEATAEEIRWSTGCSGLAVPRIAYGKCLAPRLLRLAHCEALRSLTGGYSS